MHLLESYQQHQPMKQFTEVHLPRYYSITEAAPVLIGPSRRRAPHRSLTCSVLLSFSFCLNRHSAKSGHKTLRPDAERERERAGRRPLSPDNSKGNGPPGRTSHLAPLSLLWEKLLRATGYPSNQPLSWCRYSLWATFAF